MSASSTAAGLALAVAAACCFDGAVALQALEVRAQPGGSPLALVRRPRWLAATALAIAGWPLQIAALALAPLALVQPALACGLVLLLWLGVRMLGEPARGTDLAAAAVIGAGLALLVWGAGAERPARPGVAAVAVAVLAAAAALPWVLRLPGGVLIACVGAGYAGSALGTKLIADHGLLWAPPTAAVAGIALMGEMAALRRRGAARVAAGAFAWQTVIPVALEPVVTAARWERPAAVAAALVLVVGAGLVLGTASPAARLMSR